MISPKLVVKAKQFPIPFQFKGLSDINESIYYQLLTSQDHQYFVQSEVSEKNFQLFLDYWINDKKINITEDNYFDLKNLAQEFGLANLNKLVQARGKGWEDKELDLLQLSNQNIKDNSQIEANISQNLDKYIMNYGSQLMRLDIQTLLNIFNNPTKNFTEHDQAYNLILKYYKDTKNDKIFAILPQIDGEKLSPANLEDTVVMSSERYGFMANISRNAFQNFNTDDYLKLQKKFEKLKKEYNELANRFADLEIIIFKPYDGDTFEGIFNYLTHKTGGNIHDNHTIRITSSSTQKGRFPHVMNPKNLCDFNDLTSRSMWSPDNEKDAILLFDLLTRKVNLTHYLLHTPANNTGDYPMGWRIDCSNDCENWELVDEREGELGMSEANSCCTFECQGKSKHFYRFVKLTTCGPCCSAHDRFFFDLSAVEFFGILVE